LRLSIYDCLPRLRHSTIVIRQSSM
jgi:hypothetical protein